ncbi:hypothetical protein OSB04_005001 [Centaurea solstitialis]|uniref:AIG1-type G domain-containing protein n=1 Tax=Centaurea solstitialis TaxID=347529 RepID=A0AA38TQR6_9ASTR|nr:hypothetical protein OSB04_005001 [Centaurea solstitialis]
MVVAGDRSDGGGGRRSERCWFQVAAAVVLSCGGDVYRFWVSDGLRQRFPVVSGDAFRRSPAKDIIRLCGNRCVLFDNRTKDETKKADQVQQLLAHVNKVLETNGGEPYTNDIFIEMKKREKAYQGNSKEEHKRHDEWFEQFIDMIELRFINLRLEFERVLFEERTARAKAEREAKAAMKKAEDDIKKLRKELKDAKEQSSNGCVIL